MNPGNIIVFRDGAFGRDRYWQVLSVCLAAEGHESLIELRPINYAPGRDVDGKQMPTIYVPEVLLRGLEIYEIKVVK